LPFDFPNENVLTSAITCGAFLAPDYVPEEVQGLLRRLLARDPAERISAARLKEYTARLALTIRGDLAKQKILFIRTSTYLIDTCFSSCESSHTLIFNNTKFFKMLQRKLIMRP